MFGWITEAFPVYLLWMLREHFSDLIHAAPDLLHDIQMETGE